MGNFSDAIRAATGAVVCSVLAGTEAASYFGSSLVLGGGNTDFADGVRQLRRWVCDNPDPDVDVPQPSFTGGQCPTLYNGTVTGTWTFTNGNSSNFSATYTNLQGPITGLSQQTVSPSTTAVVLTWTGGGSAEVSRQALSSVQGVSFSGNFSRADGQPDNCGDLPGPEIPPYSPVTITQNITYEDNSQTTVNEDGDFTINAPVIIGGNLIAPVTVNLGGLEIPVELNLSTGDISVEIGGGLDDTPAPIDETDPIDNPTTDKPDVESELIYGLIVYSTPTGSGRVASTIVAQSQAPTLLLPRTGNVWFQVPIGDRVSWLGPIPVQAENSLIRVPWGMGASGYRLVPSSGWEMSAVRVGKPPCGCVSA